MIALDDADEPVDAYEAIKAFVAIRENVIDGILEGEYWAQHFEEEKRLQEQM